MKYSKYHALGNDYLVISPQDLAFELTPEKIERICHRNFGIGSDGILFGPLASGSSSSAAAAVAYKLNLCDSHIAVHMPGGQIAIAISDDFTVTMTGAVTKVADGLMSPEVFEY
ncbi:MAG: hypothetical protein KME52_11570 [Desmonostoc geniculatum HA4340-LM1]|nr:hypothetical protein [Desmonostoc geniculatum HA4340-LM1]